MAAASWVAVAALLLAAWVACAAGGSEHIYIAILIAETACVMSAIAAVLNLRCYAARICRLIRLMNGVEAPRDAEVRDFSRRR